MVTSVFLLVGPPLNAATNLGLDVYLGTNYIYLNESPAFLTSTSDTTVYVCTTGYDFTGRSGGRLLRWSSGLGWQELSNSYFIGLPLRLTQFPDETDYLWLCGYLESVGTTEPQAAGGIARFRISTGTWEATPAGLYVNGSVACVAKARWVNYPYSQTYYYVGGNFDKGTAQNFGRIYKSGHIWGWNSIGNLPYPPDDDQQDDGAPAVNDIAVKPWAPNSYCVGYELLIVGNWSVRGSPVTSRNIAIFRHNFNGYDGWFNAGAGLRTGYFLQNENDCVWNESSGYTSGSCCVYSSSLDKVFIGGSFRIVDTSACLYYLPGEPCPYLDWVSLATWSGNTLARIGNWRALPKPRRVFAQSSDVYFLSNPINSAPCGGTEPVGVSGVWRYRSGTFSQLSNLSESDIAVTASYVFSVDFSTAYRTPR